MGTRTHDTARLNPCQCDKEDNKGWTFEEVLVASLLPFLGLWAGVPVNASARYVRGLLIRPSHILQIFPYFSIIYSDASQADGPVKALRKAGAYQKGDERILGSSTFVEEVLSQANEQMEQKYRLAAEGFDLDRAVKRVAKLMDISPEDVMDSGKGRRSVQARGVLCYWATDQLGVSQSRLAAILNLTQPAISQAVNRGKRLAKMHKYSQIDEKDL
jgi:DNA-binding transcriptional regulator YdaS (Cro superfamily)